jgi:hypothetical protein
MEAGTSENLVLLGTQEYDFDLCGGFAVGSQAVIRFLRSVTYVFQFKIYWSKK